jgi:hypothetical protein
MSILNKIPVLATGFMAMFLAVAIPAGAAEEAAAKIEFVFGTASIVSAGGEKRAVEKGSPVFVGDTVVTLDARAQLRFTDGAFVALLPGSEFKVNAYTYNGKPDGNERLSMTLLKGGLRTISGIIGKSMQTAYEMLTKVATIGIRGTEYTVVYGQSITGTVAHGRITVCNGGGCLDVAQGQSYYVRDESTKPVFTNKAAQLPPPQPDLAHRVNRSRDGEPGSVVITTWGWKRSESAAATVSMGDGAGNGSPGGGLGNSNAGGAGAANGAAQGIGFQLIGSTAPNVQDPAQRVSNFLQQNLLPGAANGNGLAYGRGGKPN